MNWKTWVPLTVAIVLGLAAVKLGGSLMRGNAAPGSAKRGPTVQVVIAKADVEPGHALGEVELAVAEMPTDSAPQSGFGSIADVAGRAPIIGLVKGQAIVESLLAPRDGGTGLGTLVPRGMRAVTMEVNEFTGVAGLLVPSCRVDVLGTYNGPDASQIITRVVAENVKVVAVAQRTGKAEKEGGDIAKSITLIATPEQAQAIDLVVNAGRARLVLRNGTDNSPTLGDGTSVAQIFGVGKKSDGPDPWATAFGTNADPTPPTTRPEQAGESAHNLARSVDVIRAGNISTVTFIVSTPLEPTTRPKFGLAGTDASPQ